MADRCQPKAQTIDDIQIETFVRGILNDVLPKSVNGTPTEWGGVIHRDNRTRKLGQTGPFHEPGSSVNIRQEQPNMGCPEGTTPVAWYHTHPYASRPGRTFAEKEFIGNDKDISDEHHIPGYLGVYDGTFWRYDPPATEGGAGCLVPLNGRLKNTVP